MAGFSTGIGLNLWGQEFAYAWVPYGDLGDTQYFSLLVKFGAHEDKKNLAQYQTIKTNRTAQGLRTQESALSTDVEYQQLMQLLSSEEEHLASGKLN